MKEMRICFKVIADIEEVISSLSVCAGRILYAFQWKCSNASHQYKPQADHMAPHAGFLLAAWEGLGVPRESW